MPRFVHFRCLKDYSLLGDAFPLKDLCKRALKLEQSACAIPNHVRTCDNGTKVPMGYGLYICHVHTDKTSPRQKQCNHLILLAENTQYRLYLVKLEMHGLLTAYSILLHVDKDLHFLCVCSESDLDKALATLAA